MLAGHARKTSKNKRLRELTSDTDDSDKENAPLTSTPTSTPGEFPPRLSAKRRREEGFDKLATMFQVTMEKQEEFHKNQNVANEALITEHHRANDEARMGREEVRAMRDEMRLARETQERTSIALLDILKQGLL